MDSNDATEPKLFTFSQLKEMTDDFSVERKLGEGAYGVVYKVRSLRLLACLIAH